MDSIFTDTFKAQLKNDIEKLKQNLEERKKFIGPPLPYELILERISKKAKEQES